MSEIKNNTDPFINDRFDWKKYFNYKNIVQNIPFMLFLSLMAILYIYNGHYADKLIRKISKSEKNVKELEYEYKTIKSDVIFRSKPTEMKNAVEPMGLKELKEPPIDLSDTMIK
jgi:predicted membrane protein